MNEPESADRIDHVSEVVACYEYDALHRRAILKRYLAGIGFVAACSIGVILAMFFQGQSGAGEQYLSIGLLFGVLYGASVSLNIWSSLGQRRHFIRILLAFCASASLIGALWFGMIGADGFQMDYSFVVLIVGSMVLQALLIQACFWTLRVLFGLSLIDQQNQSRGHSNLQFGIIHILGLTLAVAITLAVGKALLANLKFEGASNNDFFIFVFIAVMAALMTIPLGLACLVANRFGLSIFLALAGTIAIGVLSYPAFESLGLAGLGPDKYHLLAINLGSLIVVLIFTIGLRFFGYRLTFVNHRT